MRKTYLVKRIERNHSQASRMRKNEAGAALLEYAFIFMMFMTLIFGVSGFGHAMFTYHQINHVAKEATRYASVRWSACSNDGSCVASNSASGTAGATTTADIQQFVQNMTPTSIDTTKLVVSACGVSGTTYCAASLASGPQVCSAAVGTLPATDNYP